MDLARIIPSLLRATIPLSLAIVGAFIIALGFANLLDENYEARAVVDINRLLNDQDAFVNTERADRTVANEMVLAQEPAVTARAAERLGAEDVESLSREVDVEPLVGTDNIGFTAKADEPAAAAAKANAYAAAYAGARLERRRSTLTAEAEEIAREMEALPGRIAALPNEDSPEAEAEAEALRQRYSTLVNRELELRASTSADRQPSEFVDAAPVPVLAAGLKPLSLAALAALLAGCLGVLAVAIRSRAVDLVEYRADVEEFGLTILAERGGAKWASRRRDVPTDAIREAALDVAMRDPVPSMVAVLATDLRDNTDIARRLLEELQQQDDQSSARQVKVINATAPAWHVASRPLIKEADLLLLVVVLGNTRRADLASSTAALGDLATVPKAALLIV